MLDLCEGCCSYLPRRPAGLPWQGGRPEHASSELRVSCDISQTGLDSILLQPHGEMSTAWQLYCLLLFKKCLQTRDGMSLKALVQ